MDSNSSNNLKMIQNHNENLGNIGHESLPFEVKGMRDKGITVTFSELVWGANHGVEFDVDIIFNNVLFDPLYRSVSYGDYEMHLTTPEYVIFEARKASSANRIRNIHEDKEEVSQRVKNNLNFYFTKALNSSGLL